MSAMPAVADGLLFNEARGPLHAILVVLFWGAPVLLVLILVTWVFAWPGHAFDGQGAALTDV